MELAALLFSALALVVAAGSAWYTRSQAEEAKRVRRIEAARRHGELAPQLTPRIESVNDGSWYRLWLTLESPRPVDRIEVILAEGQTSYFTSGQNGVAPMSARPDRAVYEEISPLRQGQRHAWRIEFATDRDPELAFTVTCHGPDENGEPSTWSQLLRLPAPPLCRWELVPTKGARPVHGAGCPCGLRTTPLNDALSQISRQHMPDHDPTVRRRSACRCRRRSGCRWFGCEKAPPCCAAGLSVGCVAAGSAW